MSTDKPRRLGRGLDALLATRPAAPVADRRQRDRGAPQTDRDRRDSPEPLSAAKGVPARRAGRAGGVTPSNGLLQAITVRPAASGHGYELIAGERRLRAATRLGWKEIPAVVKDNRRSRTAHTRAGREPPTSRSECDRGGRGISAPRCRIHADAERGSGDRRQGQVDSS